MNMQPFETHLSDAIETVSSWDLPEEDFACAVNSQARLMAGIEPEEYWCPASETSTH